MLAEMVGSLMPFLQNHGNEMGAFDKLMDPNEKGESQLKSHEKVGHAKLGAQRSKEDQNKQQRDRQQWVGHINSSAKKNNNYFHYHFHYHSSQITPRFYSPAQRQTRVALGFRGNLFALAHLRCLSLDTAFCFFWSPPLPPALSTRPHPNDDLRSPADKPSTCPGRIPNSRAAALLSYLYFETGVASPLQQNRTRHQRAERRGGSQVTSVALLLFAKHTIKIFGNATLGVDLWSDICGSAHTGLGRLSRRTCGRSHRSIRSGSTAAGHHAEKWS